MRHERPQPDDLKSAGDDLLPLRVFRVRLRRRRSFRQAVGDGSRHARQQDEGSNRGVQNALDHDGLRRRSNPVALASTCIARSLEHEGIELGSTSSAVALRPSAAFCAASEMLLFGDLWPAASWLHARKSAVATSCAHMQHSASMSAREHVGTCAEGETRSAGQGINIMHGGKGRPSHQGCGWSTRQRLCRVLPFRIPFPFHHLLFLSSSFAHSTVHSLERGQGGVMECR